MVVKGCAQRRNFDYTETYSPVAHVITVKALLSVINHEGLYARQLDVKNAFLHGTISEKIYIKKPHGIHNQDDLVCRLNKSLYGLKQAPRTWNARFDEFLKNLNLKRSKNDKCLYTCIIEDSKLYLLLYVDDIIIVENNKLKLLQLRDALMQEFLITDLKELKNFLGIKI